MRATAYFHPTFGEELAALSHEERIAFYLLIMEQEKSGPLASDFKSHIFQVEFRKRIHSWFPLVSENRAAFLDTRTHNGGFVYFNLGIVTTEDDEEIFLATCAERRNDIEVNSIELLRFDDLLDQGNREDVLAAYDIAATREKHQLDLYLINQSFKESEIHLRNLFNLSPLQYSRLETRIDFYLKTLQNTLSRDGLTLSLQVKSTDEVCFSAASFAALSRLS